MRRTTRIGGLLALGFAGLWGGSASAYTATCNTNCNNCCATEEYYTVYTPARYAGFSSGDVAVNTLPASGATFGQEVVGAMIGQLGGVTASNAYIHAKLLNDSSGNVFTETYPGPTPPPSSATGESNECSSIISPFALNRMYPGVGIYAEDAEPGVVVRGFGTPGCSPGNYTYGPGGSDGYHLFSILNDSVPGGSCEKLLVDYCGVPVEYNKPGVAGDRITYTTQESLNAITQVFAAVYGACMQTIGGSWPWNGIGCGGTSEETACQRVGWQVINTAYYAAQPLQTDVGWNGWSNYNVLTPDTVTTPENPIYQIYYGPFPPVNYNATSGTMLGASKTIWESLPNGTLCPGAQNNGGANTTPGTGWSCPGSAYEPASFVANIPQNLVNAAARLGKTVANGEIVNVSVGSGIDAGYDTTCCHCVGRCLQ
jgi:hypothetical protein